MNVEPTGDDSANSPALHHNLPFFLQHHAETQSDTEQSRLFVGDGTLNDARFRIPSQKWIKHWSDRDDKRLKGSDPF